MLKLFSVIFLSLLSVTLFSQESNIRGKVTDNNGEPLIGVSIIVKGSSNGTITDIEGEFQLSVDPTQTLVLSMVGMETLELGIANRSYIEAIMSESTDVLEEVVITGFQQVDRKLFTGASENIKMDHIPAAGMTDISRMLEGQSAGVNVDNVSGTFGSSPKIRIRGNASINGNNQPLYVVDGVILEDLTNVNTEDFISGNANTLVSSSVANINPDDIESFQIL